MLVERNDWMARIHRLWTWRRKQLQEGVFVVVNWAPKSEPAAAAEECPPDTLMSAARHLQVLLSLPPLTKVFLALHFDQWAETCPIQSVLHNYVFICTHTDQSEQLHNNKSDRVKPTNQNSAIWTNKIVQIWIHHLHKN